MNMFWFIMFVVFLVIEIITVGLVSIWFSFGSLFALLSTCFTDNIIIQSIVFVVFSLALIFICRPLFKSKFFKSEATNYGKYIGKTGIVTKEITSNNYGEVKVDGTIWTAKASKKIKVDEKVKVLDIEGVKLIVERDDN